MLVEVKNDMDVVLREQQRPKDLDGNKSSNEILHSLCSFRMTSVSLAGYEGNVPVDTANHLSQRVKSRVYVLSCGIPT